jgi:putative PIN family toxin of toxin-antitoxin system
VRIVIDTNVWVSGVLTRLGAPARVVDLFMEGRYTLVTSEPLLSEAADVLARPRIARRSRLTRAEVAALVAAMRDLGEIAPIAGVVSICRDPDDDLVIETAISGRADALVSGDRDLTADPMIAALLDEADVRVLTVAQLVYELEAAPE